MRRKILEIGYCFKCDFKCMANSLVKIAQILSISCCALRLVVWFKSQSWAGGSLNESRLSFNPERCVNFSPRLHEGLRWGLKDHGKLHKEFGTKKNVTNFKRKIYLDFSVYTSDGTVFSLISILLHQSSSLRVKTLARSQRVETTKRDR